VAILFGSEKVGLSNADLSHCDWLMRIPAYGDQISMNLGQAVAICLYELIRDGRARESAEGRKQDVPREHGRRYRTHHSRPVRCAAEKRLRPVERRRVIEKKCGVCVPHDLGHEDADLWLGMLRQILWKLTPKLERPFERPIPLKKVPTLARHACASAGSQEIFTKNLTIIVSYNTIWLCN